MLCGLGLRDDAFARAYFYCGSKTAKPDQLSSGSSYLGFSVSAVQPRSISYYGNVITSPKRASQAPSASIPENIRRLRDVSPHLWLRRGKLRSPARQETY